MKTVVWLYQDSAGVNYAVGSTGRAAFKQHQPETNDIFMINLKRIHDLYKGDVEFRNKVPDWARDAEAKTRPFAETRFNEILDALKGK